MIIGKDLEGELQREMKWKTKYESKTLFCLSLFPPPNFLCTVLGWQSCFHPGCLLFKDFAVLDKNHKPIVCLLPLED